MEIEAKDWSSDANGALGDGLNVTGQTVGAGGAGQVKRALHSAQVTHLSTANSTDVALAAGDSFTGEWEDALNYTTLVCALKCDQAATLYLQFSPDAVNIDSSLPFSVAENVNEIHRLVVTRRFFRVQITNTSLSNMTFLRLQTTFGNHNIISSPLNSSIQSDADSIITRSVLYGETDGGHFLAVPVTSEGHLETAIHGPLLPFGAVHTENMTPIFQADAVYGLNSQLTKETTGGSGTASTVDSSFVCSTGATVFSQATIQSRKRLRYRAGQGSIVRFTGRFTPPVANSYQVIGMGHPEDGYFFAYQGTDFGILHSSRGVREIQTLTINGASTTAENLSVTLNGVSFPVPVTNSGSTLRTAYEVASYNYAGWESQAIGSTVVFLAASVGNKAGAFTFSGTTASGTFVETRAGAPSTDVFIPQTTWNSDKLDGTGASGVTLDQTKGNVFQINMQYLGSGAVQFMVLVAPAGNNPTWVLVHSINNPNSATKTHVANPSFPFTMAAYSGGSTTDISVYCGSFAGFIEGQRVLHGGRFSYFNSITTVGAINYQALFTIACAETYKGKASQSVINLISVSGAVKHNSPVIYYLIKGGTLGGNPNFTRYATDSSSLLDTAATTVTFATNDQLLWSGHLGETGDIDHHFTMNGLEEFTLQPGEWVTLAARSTAGSPSFVTGSINTREDQ